jgi:DNA (cytosine-5)-methyltransferase 1
LVQLNGYYQYTNDISFSFVKSSKKLESNFWKVVELILIDPTIGQIKDINHFASGYELRQDEILECFYDLRKIGFEIRNNNTNPEISDNEYLIPYRFPTLTPLSVQLKKSLQAHG